MTTERLDSLEREVALVRERLSRAEDRVRALEGLDDRIDEHDRQLDELRRDLMQLRQAVDRLLSASTKQGLTLDKVHSLLEQLVRQQTPSVEVNRG